MTTHRRINRLLQPLLLLSAIALVVSGCAPPTPPTPSDSPTPDPSPSAEGTGWAINFEENTGAVIGTYTGLSCDSPYGPWHVVVTTSATTTAFDVFFDFTADETGVGPLTGSERTAWPDGYTSNGTYSGTATIAVTDDPEASRSLTLSYDQTIQLHDPNAITAAEQNRTLENHRVKEMVIEPAAEGECD